MPRPAWWNLPNQLTLSRIVIAFVLFVLLALHLAGRSPFPDEATALWVAAIVFVVCVSTDWLDGFIARRRNQVTSFGRIADPFADKLLVLGTLIFMVELCSLIEAWFVVTLLAREFLVSGLRSFLESQGVPFGARWGGKIKMILQSVMIPAVFVEQAVRPAGGESGYETFVVVLIYATLAATVLSMVDYIRVAAGAVGGQRAKDAAP